MKMIAAKQLRVGDGPVPAAVGWAGRSGQQGLNRRPQLVRYEVVNEGRHGAGACHAQPKRAKQRPSR